MNTNWKRRSRRSMAGVTLVEAVAGTAVLGSLLVSILIGAVRLQGQAGRAERRLEACRVADQLLEAWWRVPEEFPRRDEGEVSEGDGWLWRTEVVPGDADRSLRGEVVALEVFAAGGRDGDPAARVEVFLPEKEDVPETRPDAG